jgi:hypothetical protein
MQYLAKGEVGHADVKRGEEMIEYAMTCKGMLNHWTYWNQIETTWNLTIASMIARTAPVQGLTPHGGGT